MPELPEVETVVRSIAPHIVGKKIVRAEFKSYRVTRGGFDETARALQGKLIKSIGRRGKHILIDLRSGTLYVHLGMTGKLLWNATPGKYTRAILYFAHGDALLYDDVRQFGRVEFLNAKVDLLERAGPDALSVPFEEFFSRLQKHRTMIKPLLLNQTFVSGVGNIYADELLFGARVHPRTVANRISKIRARRIYDQMIQILRLAIEHRGSSISDYVDGSGARGGFQQLHAVYGRAAQPCLHCGTIIRRIVLGQRGTHYCPRCQRV